MNAVSPVETLVTDHLDLWTAAIKRKSTAGRGSSSKVELYGIKKLRELILELAVRGLLVPQDPNDEPASELLKKIAAEKVRLVKAGKIKKEKPLPPIGDREKSFDIPSGWEWCRLQDISEYIQRGKGPIYADSGLVRVVSQKCVQWSGIDISASRFVDDASLSGYKEERFLKSQDLLWNSTGTGTVGRANVLGMIAEKTLVADSHVTVIRTLGVHAKYFCNYICSPGVQNRIEPSHESSLVSGSTQQVELNTSAVVLLPIPVPPLPEQHRIVAKVDELMALCDLLEQQTGASLGAHQTLVETLLRALTGAADHAQFASAWQRFAGHFDTLFTTEESIDQLKQTILQLAVMGKLVPQVPNDEPASELLKKIAAEKAKLVKEGKIKKDKPSPPIAEDEKPFELPSGWVWSRWNNIAKKIGDIDHKMPNEEPDGIPYVSPRDFYPNNIVDFSRAKKISRSDFEKLAAKIQPKRGDIIFPRYGTIGENVLVESDIDFLASYSCCVIKTLKGYISAKYQFFYSISAFVNQQCRMAENKTTQPNVGIKSIQEFVVPLPPLAEQHRIVAKVDELMALCDQLKSRLSDAQTTQLHLADALVERAIG